MKRVNFFIFISLGVLSLTSISTDAAVAGWTNWRGPHQAGRSDATDLPKAIKLTGVGSNLLWTHDIAGRGHAVIADGRVYAWGYRGAGPDLQEVLLCLNEADGKTIWEHGYNGPFNAKPPDECLNEEILLQP